jgi:hypothetical protein
MFTRTLALLAALAAIAVVAVPAASAAPRAPSFSLPLCFNDLSGSFTDPMPLTQTATWANANVTRIDFTYVDAWVFNSDGYPIDVTTKTVSASGLHGHAGSYTFNVTTTDYTGDENVSGVFYDEDGHVLAAIDGNGC